MSRWSGIVRVETTGCEMWRGDLSYVVALGTKSSRFQRIHFAETQSLGPHQLILEAIPTRNLGAPAVSTPQMVVVFEALTFGKKCGSVGGFNRFEHPVSGQGIEVAIHGGEADFRAGSGAWRQTSAAERIDFLVQGKMHQFERLAVCAAGTGECRGHAPGQSLPNRGVRRRSSPSFHS